DAYDNLESGGAPALHLRAGGKPGVAVIQMASPYVYLGGRVKVRAFRTSASDTVTVSLSTNNARTFAPIWQADRLGACDATIDLKNRVLRRYAYWLKIEIRATTPRGAGLNALSIETDFQHAPRTLPWPGKGSN